MKISKLLKNLHWRKYKLKLYCGYIGTNKDIVQQNWVCNIKRWFTSKKNFRIENIKDNFFCLLLDIDLSTGLNSVKNVDSFIDGSVFLDSNIYNNENVKEDVEILKKNCISQKSYGRYTFFYLQDGTFHVFNDYYGFKPFYYYLDKNNNLFFSNDIRILLLCDFVPFQLNIDKCKLICTSSFIETENFQSNTFFFGISKMPEGVHFTYDGNKIIIKKIFYPDNFRKDDFYLLDKKEDYYKLFRKELNKVIKNFVDASNSQFIGVSLSGGIDSAVILASLIDLGFKDRIICYHGTSKNPLYYTCDDSYIAKNLIKHFHVKGKIININDGNTICNAILGRDFIKNIDGPCCLGNDSFGYKLSAELEKDGVKLILGGDGGDYMFMGTRYCLDMLKHNHLYTIIKERNIQLKGKVYNKFIYRFVQFIPGLNNYFYNKTLWRSDSEKEEYPSYFSKEMNRLSKKNKLNKNFKESKKLKFWCRRHIYDFMFPKGLNEDENSDGYEFIHPLLDKNIYDLCQRIPPYIHYDITKGELGSYIVQKRILRESYKDLLPDFITQQKSKTNYAPSLILKLKREKDNICKTIIDDPVLYLEKYNIVEKQKFLKKLNIFFANINDPHFVPTLETKYIFSLIYLEIWFKEINKGRKWVLSQCKITSKIKQSNDIEVING